MSTGHAIATASTDLRIATFCSAETPEIFRPVAYPTEVWTPDPFDVETIHEQARDAFGRALSRATSPDGNGGKTGRILLLKGESGSGKTHLMRAFRTQAHQQGLGYFGYMQMTSSSGNYSRYMLHKLIDSLDKPYYRTPIDPDETTGLMRLSTAVAESDRIARGDLRCLQEDDLSHTERAELVVDLADAVAGDPRLRGTDLDLLRAMLFLQSGHAGARSRVMKYLRGESLSASDQERLGGITPLDRDESAQEMLYRLGRLMWATQQAAMILCVDQLEDIFQFDQAAEKFRRAMQGLISVASHVSSSLVIIACLEDYYDKLRNLLDKPHQDRIEGGDPAPVTLVANRTPEEIAPLVGTHLRYLFESAGAAFDQADSVYPLPAGPLDELAGRRTRDVLQWCRDYRQACIAAGRLLSEVARRPEAGHDDSETTPDVVEVEQAWNDFLARDLPGTPEDEEDLAALLNDAIHLCAEEIETGHRFDTNAEGRFVHVVREAGGGEPDRRWLVGLCNKAPQGGGLGGQVKETGERARRCEPPETPVIVRSTDFPQNPKTQIAKQIGALVASGGRRVAVQDTDWRTMHAMRQFRAEHAGHRRFRDWLTQSRPLARLRSLRQLLELDELQPITRSAKSPEAAPAEATPVESNASPARSSAPDGMVTSAEAPPAAEPAAGPVFVGRTRDRAAQPVWIEPDWLTRHAAFLGSTGSGKTTAALNIIEQLLLRGVPALLVDRKGDLAAYARQSAWETPPDDPALAARQRRLRERIEVAVYTPGRIDGRPLALAVAPDRMGELNAADRQFTARQAAHSLGDMLGYGTTGANASRISIMVKAIELLAEQGEERITLDLLINYLHECDSALVNAIGMLDAKLFDRLVQDLQTLRINRSHLFPEAGEPLDADALLGLGDGRTAGRTRLSIISTKFLGDTTDVQFWVAQLLLELGRWMSRKAAETLQAVVLFDEADLYLPASRKPATKEPMENLLKRARSAGLGVFLATQSPGDLDYRCRENINTWMVGKIKEDTAIRKMKPMLSALKLNVSTWLPGLQTGEFFLVHGDGITPVQSDRSAVETAQLPEHEILELAVHQAM